LRIAALLHDVGHGPFGHFFDSHFLADFDLTHEKLGAIIIRRELGELIRSIRRSPKGRLLPGEILDPEQVAFLIVRPEKEDTIGVPRWLRLLRTLFCGLYTVDNMDFVLRDAYFTGVNRSGFNLDRLLHYTFFSPQGLTIHQKGFSTLTQFLAVRAELFRSVYFHRTVRAVDLTLTDLFKQSKPLLFPIRECLGTNVSHNPAENLGEYRFLTDRSLMSEIAFWHRSEQPERRRLGELWGPFLRREIPWKVAAETTALFQSDEKERSSIFSNPTLFETAIRTELPKELREIELRVDIARHLHRPGKNLPTKNLNFLYDANSDRIRSLEEEEMFRHIPHTFKICRVYTKYAEHRKAVAESLSKLLFSSGGDDLTNM
jgi:HD superfamily phosphohydrolase